MLRKHLVAAARSGNIRAKRALEGPEFPEALAYLYDWLFVLHGRSGATLDGLAPLSFQTLDAWARLMNADVTPEEANALLVLDGILLHPPELEQGERDG